MLQSLRREMVKKKKWFPLWFMMVSGMYTMMFIWEIPGKSLPRMWYLKRKMDAFAARSQNKAAEAEANGWLIGRRFEMPELSTDEGVRAGTTIEKLAGLGLSSKKMES